MDLNFHMMAPDFPWSNFSFRA